MKPKRYGRYAYALLPSEIMDRGVKQVHPIIVMEGESGYWKTDWTWARENAEECRDAKNAAMGLTPEEADKILSQSMFGTKPRRRVMV